MKVILVTGGAGFIGSNFIRYFLRRNKSFIIVNLDKLTYSSNWDNIKDMEDSPRHHFVKGDICNQELVNYILKRYRPEYIINFAAESDADRSLEHPSLFAQTNVMGTLTLLEGARYIWSKNNFKGTRFLQISSDAVYGENTSNDFLLEESELLPSNPYAASKASADLMAMSYSKVYGIPVIITRFCNTYGPYQNHEKFIPKCIIHALQDRAVPLCGDGTAIREWIHVLDHCVAVIRALFYGKPGEIYNIGTGEELPEIEVAKKILSLINKPEDLLSPVSDRYIKDKRYGLNSYKARSSLNWSSKLILNEGLKDTIQWYKINRHRWE